MRGEHGGGQSGIAYEVGTSQLEVELKIERAMAGSAIEERRTAVEELVGGGGALEEPRDEEDCENGDARRLEQKFLLRRDMQSSAEPREVGLLEEEQMGMDEEGPTTPTGPAGSEVDRKDRIYKKGPWSVPEMLVLQSAKREDVVRAGKGAPGIKHRTAQEKWQSIEDYCWVHFVQRSAQQCQDKWESMSAEFKKVKDFECGTLPGQKPYWLMSIDERKSVRVPPNFQKEVYTALWEWYDKNRIIEPGMRRHRHPRLAQFSHLPGLGLQFLLPKFPCHCFLIGPNCLCTCFTYVDGRSESALIYLCYIYDFVRVCYL